MALPAVAGRSGSTRGAIAQGIKYDFHAAGNSQLVEDAKQIILHGVFGELQALRDFAVGETLRQTSNDVRLSCGQQRSVGGLEVCQCWFSQRFEQKLQFLAAGPYLSLMNTLNALAQQSERLGAAEHSLGASAKCFNHGCALGGIEKDDHPCGRRLRVDFAHQIVASTMVFSQLGAHDHDLRFLALDQVEKGERIGCRLDHVELRVARKRFHQQLCTHGSAVRG